MDYTERKDKLRELIRKYESKKQLDPEHAFIIDGIIDGFGRELRGIEEREVRERPWLLRQAKRPAGEVIGEAGGVVSEKISEGARKAQKYASEKARKAREAYQKSIWGRDIGEMIKDNKHYRRTKWKAIAAKEWAKGKGRGVDERLETYFPTFRKAAKGGGRLIKSGVKGTASGVKSVGGAVLGAGTNVVKIGLRGDVQPIYVGFWLILTLGLQLIDFFFLHFGGLDYNVFMDAVRNGGLELLFRLVLPFYVVIALVVLLALKYAKSRKIGVFLLVIFVPLLIINRYAINYKIFGISLPIISLIISTAILVWRLDEERYDFLSWVLLVLTGSTIISLGGLTSGFHHLVVAGLIWAFLIKHPGEEKFTRANYWISILLIIDFFGYGLWQSFGPMQSNTLIANRFVFPLWFLFVVFYSAGQENYKASGFDKFIMVVVILFYLIALVDGVYGWTTIRAQIQSNPQEVAEARSFFKDAFSKLKAFPGKIFDEYKKGMEYATGGYYQGKVEENQDPRNELGVHIDNLEAADKGFYQNEEIVLWGDLKAKTLDKPIKVYMSCESDGIKGSIKPDNLGDSKEGYGIEKLEQIAFECRFDKNKLKAGTNNVKVKAEFNFETLGYLKTYFMDVERMRALRKENIDPLREYGVDKKPDAMYTNGPVKLGIGTVDPPVGLSTTKDGYSYIGVTVQPQWYGRIKNITNLNIQVPKDLQVEKEGDLYCRNGFEMAEEDNEGYSVYRMTKEEIKKIKTPISDYKSWRCSINIPTGNTRKILGNTPIAVYYYRAGVSYIYEIEQSTTVYVKEVPEEKRILLDCKIECDDSDGCICDADGCSIKKGETISNGYTCDNYPSASNILRDYDRNIKDINEASEFISVYLALNEVCVEGKVSDENKALIEKFDWSKKEKEEILNIKCGERGSPASFIEEKMGEITEKVDFIMDLFKNTQGKELISEQKSTLNKEKEEFKKLLYKVKAAFEIYDKKLPEIQDAKYEQYNGDINKAINNLEIINF